MLSQEDKIYLEGKFATFATKDDLKGFATKDDLKGFATKDDLKGFATKDDLKGFATKDDLKGFATNEKLEHETDFLAREIYKVYDTIDEFKTEFREFKNNYYTGQDKVVKLLEDIKVENSAMHLNYLSLDKRLEEHIKLGH